MRLNTLIKIFLISLFGIAILLDSTYACGGSDLTIVTAGMFLGLGLICVFLFFYLILVGLRCLIKKIEKRKK